MSLFNQDDYKPVPFYIKKEEYTQWIKLFTEIETSIKLKKRITNSVLKEFFSYLIRGSTLRLDTQISETLPILAVVRTFLNNNKEYELEKSDENVPFSKSFQLVSYIALSYNGEKEKDEELAKDKDKAFAFFYKIILHVLENYAPERQEQFTQYRVVVLAARFTEAAGFKLTTQKNPTNRDLFQACRNAMQKISKSTKEKGGEKKS